MAWTPTTHPLPATPPRYPHTPGIYTVAQVEAWKPVVEAVHDKGATFYLRERRQHLSSAPHSRPWLWVGARAMWEVAARAHALLLPSKTLHDRIGTSAVPPFTRPLVSRFLTGFLLPPPHTHSNLRAVARWQGLPPW